MKETITQEMINLYSDYLKSEIQKDKREIKSLKKDLISNKRSEKRVKNISFVIFILIIAAMEAIGITEAVSFLESGFDYETIVCYFIGGVATQYTLFTVAHRKTDSLTAQEENFDTRIEELENKRAIEIKKLSKVSSLRKNLDVSLEAKPKKFTDFLRKYSVASSEPVIDKASQKVLQKNPKK